LGYLKKRLHIVVQSIFGLGLTLVCCYGDLDGDLDCVNGELVLNVTPSAPQDVLVDLDAGECRIQLLPEADGGLTVDIQDDDLVQISQTKHSDLQYNQPITFQDGSQGFQYWSGGDGQTVHGGSYELKVVAMRSTRLRLVARNPTLP